MKHLSCLLLLAAALTMVLATARADTRFVIVQARPTDCGPAALATLLRYYLDVPTSESEMLRLTEYRRDRGTSLLGLEKAAEAKGCATGSFLMGLATLSKQMATYPTPMIVRTLNPEPHFSVLLALDAQRVYLADPAAGNVVLTRSAFLKRWYAPGGREGFVFIVAAPGQHVNTARVHQTVERLRQGLDSLQSLRPDGAGFRR